MKYHINPTTGDPGKCSAKRKCPFGSAKEHYSSELAARKAYEKSKEADILSRVSPDKKKIYANYRNSLAASVANANSRDSRASDRKQIALAITSARYNIPISVVKTIVRELDKELEREHKQPDATVDYFFAENTKKRLEVELSSSPVLCETCKTKGQINKEPDFIRIRNVSLVKNSDGSNKDINYSLQCINCYVKNDKKFLN